ncbi:MAG: metallophosphoesterase [Eubacterium sp.]|nr:metallophosphoesterase [Eubacterium sp.]
MRKKLTKIIYKQMVKALGKVLRSDALPPYAAAEPLQPDESADLNLLVWADPQISALSPLRAARVACACKDVRRAKGRYDALILAGDLTEYGMVCEYKLLSDLLKTVAQRVDSVLAVPGNHDIRLRKYRNQVRVFDRFLGSVQGAVRLKGEGYFRTVDRKGCRFVLLGADRSSFEASYLSDAQLCKLDEALAAADPDKPVFVVNHQPLKYTNGLPKTFLGRGDWRGSVGRESDKLRVILEKYGNAVYITGHLHYGTSRYLYEKIGRFHAINVPTVGVINHGDCDAFAQGLVLTVHGNRITVRARVFGEGKYIDDSNPGAAVTFTV